MQSSKLEKILNTIVCELKLIKNLEQNWLTVEGLSSYIGLKVSTIYQYVNNNKIPFKKLPGSSKLIFSKQEIDRWIELGNINDEAKEVALEEATKTSVELWKKING